MRKIFSKIALAASLGLALAFTLSCGGSDRNDDPEISSSSSGKSSSSVARSSSSLPASTVLCLVNGTCISLALEDCFAIEGQPVQSCPASSSSSVSPPSSSSVSPPSSSSVSPPSSSSVPPPSSSSVSPPSSSSIPTPSSSSVASISSSSPVSGEFTDNRDENVYRWVRIGEQVWMAENLNYDNGSTSSKCYDGSSANCAIYGRLYIGAIANSCPSGWHLPSKAEWEVLTAYVQSDKDCTSCDAKHLKAASGWDSNGNGTDAYGFSALPGGGNYFIGKKGGWWSTSRYGENSVYYLDMDYEYDDTSWDYSEMSASFHSVRCLQN